MKQVPRQGAEAGRIGFHARASVLAAPGDPAIAGGPTGAGALKKGRLRFVGHKFQKESFVNPKIIL
jgi:hypothetical protein